MWLKWYSRNSFNLLCSCQPLTSPGLAKGNALVSAMWSKRTAAKKKQSKNTQKGGSHQLDHPNKHKNSFTSSLALSNQSLSFNKNTAPGLHWTPCRRHGRCTDRRAETCFRWRVVHFVRLNKLTSLSKEGLSMVKGPESWKVYFIVREA